MSRAVWIVAGSLASWLALIALVPEARGADVPLGMLAPLLAVVVTWVLIERTHRANPAAVTALMLKAFGVKVLFFGAYVAIVVALVGVRPIPFALSFLGYFIALYAVEAVFLTRLSSGKLEGARQP